MKKVRSYHQTVRAEMAAETTRSIMNASKELFLVHWYDEVTLDGIAARAGVSVKTVQRQFISKEQLARAAFMEIGQENSGWRDQVPAGDLDAIFSMIVAMYEQLGDSIMRYLTLEQRIPLIAEIIELGRQLHKQWVARVFAPLLPAEALQRLLPLLVVSTDVYTWRLLRRDAALSVMETANAMKTLALAALNAR